MEFWNIVLECPKKVLILHSTVPNYFLFDPFLIFDFDTNFVRISIYIWYDYYKIRFLNANLYYYWIRILFTSWHIWWSYFLLIFHLSILIYKTKYIYYYSICITLNKNWNVSKNLSRRKLRYRRNKCNSYFTKMKLILISFALVALLAMSGK